MNEFESTKLTELKIATDLELRKDYSGKLTLCWNEVVVSMPENSINKLKSRLREEPISVAPAGGLPFG